MSQKKGKKKSSFLKTTYHNITARYNGYFNACNRLSDGAKKLALSHVDNYGDILSVFKLGDDAKAKAVNTQFEETIKKSSIVIQRHDISKWVDDCYLLIGKANFYKRDYYTAIVNFQYVTSNYKNGNAQHEALVWIGKSYVQIGKYDEAESVLNIAAEDAIVQSSFREELYAVLGDLYIRKKNYTKAIEYLHKAVSSARSRDNRSRYEYIIAQLYERQNETENAYQSLIKVIDMNPPYEMSFNAKINSARLFNAKSKSSKKEIIKQLNKLLADEKNKDYRDQVYFAMGNIEEREKNFQKATELYSKSTQVSTSNVAQKAESFLHIAKIYYSMKPDLVKAQLYYDSTSTFISKSHPEYDDVMNKKKTLFILVKNLRIINTEDSLQHLATLSPKERERFVGQLIDNQIEEERLRKIAEEEEKGKVINSQNNNNLGNSGSGSPSWYFYNSSALSLGASEFIKRFGKRPLEDNWRRSNKENINPSGEDVTNNKIEDLSDPKNIEKLKKQYLANIPTTPELLDASNKKIIDAYYELGNFYKEQLVDYKESAKQYETLLQRFPDNKYKVECYYNLYRIYLNLNISSKSDEYKELILSKHPSSVFANIILNPNYLKEISSPDNKVNKFYEETYATYVSGNYSATVDRIEQSRTLFPNNFLSSKYDFLQAMCIGHLKSEMDFTQALSNIISKYPGEAVSEKSQQILDFLKKKNQPANTAENTKEIYKSSLTGDHFFLLCSEGGQNFMPVKTNLSDFNKEKFESNNLRIDAQFLNSSQQILIIRKFDDKESSMSYFNAFQKEANNLVKLDKPYNSCVISAENFVILLKDQKFDPYLQFFFKNYLGK